MMSETTNSTYMNAPVKRDEQETHDAEGPAERVEHEIQHDREDDT